MFLDIVTTITIPLLVVIALGYVASRRLSLDARTLGQLLVNVVAPGAFVYFLLSNPAPMSAVGFVTLYSFCRFFVMYLVGWLVISRFVSDPVARRACALAVAFPNSGNYGIPLVDLAFGDAWLFHQSVITSMHSVLIVALVPFLVPSRNLGFVASLRSAFSAPLLPAVTAAIVIKMVGVEVPSVVMAPLGVLAAALTPLALLTLGAQIAAAPRITDPASVAGIVSLRLVAAPLLTAASFLLFDPGEAERDYLLVNACVPVGLFLAVLLAEHKTVSQTIVAAVAVSTALAPLAVIVVLALL